MRISSLILSVCGFCILYICNADWIDDLIEDYLGSEYEEVAPFVSSVTAGTEEFDQLVEELSQFRRRWKVGPSVAVGAAVCAVGLSGLLCVKGCRGLLRSGVELITRMRGKSGSEKEEMQTMMSEFLERKLKQLCGGSKEGDEIPVKLLWKGRTLVESSIHCNIRNESKMQHLQRHLLQSQLLLKSTDGGGDEKLTLVPSSSDSSTARKMAEIRQLLESEQELSRFADKGAGTDDRAERCRGRSGSAFRKTQQEVPEEANDHVRDVRERLRKLDKTTDQGRKEEMESKTDSEWNGLPDPKLMNRIRLLESRLRLEELKNKNWISRMSRAEGILQQLNKQVERIEEARPVGTLTETLKITSTVTNWTPSPQPKRNLHFTMVNQYPPFSMQAPYMSLSELIKKEVGLPSTSDYRRNLKQLPPPARQMPALNSAATMPQSSFLSKFLCR